MAQGSTLRIRVPITVEVDLASWRDTYGDEGRVVVRESVIAYVTNQIAGSAAADAGALVVR